MDLCAPLMPHVTSLWALLPLPTPIPPSVTPSTGVPTWGARDLYDSSACSSLVLDKDLFV